MTAFLLSPGPFCGQCGHPQRTNRAYRCQSCTCTHSHRFATTTRTKKDTHSTPFPSPRSDERVRGGGNTPGPAPRRTPLLRTLRRAGWADLFPAFAGCLLLLGVATSPIEIWDIWHVIALFAGFGLVFWSVTNVNDER